MALDPGTKLGGFEIVGLLGVGGMGEVYRARDTKLGREVAIKVLPADFAADAERLARFEREAKTLASLDHPNIGALYDFQHDGDVRFLVLQLVEGESLRQRIDRGALPVRDALPLFVQIAEALAAAHAQDIVHRDLKPGNIQLTRDGNAKVLDFGLARPATNVPRSSISPTDPTLQYDPNKVTTDGSILGTPSYMSPEQARGHDIDKRSDIWAFGCCLFEALTSQTPFQGETAVQTMAAVLDDEPDWSSLPDAIPPQVESLLRRCLEKDPRRRLSSAADIAITLEEARDALKRDSHKMRAAEPRASAAPARSAGRLPLAIGAIVLLAIGVGAGFLIRGGAGREANPETTAARPIRSIAVLPFDNLMGDESKEYFVDGMTDTLTAELSKIESIKVIARTSAMKFKHTDKRMSQIATELGVEGLIEGSVQQFEDEIRITAQLIDGRNEEHLWGENFEGTLAGVMKLQGEVAVSIADQIGAVITAEARANYAEAEDVNPEAYDLYLQGRAIMQSRSAGDLRSAIDLFERAAAIDPEFALPHSGLSDVYALLTVYGLAAPGEVQGQAFAHAKKAIELSESIADGYASLGWAYTRFDEDQNWAAAERAFQRAIELNPGLPRARRWYATLLTDLGRNRDAIREARRAVDLDPLDPLVVMNLGYALQYGGQTGEAEEVLLRSAAMDPSLSIPRIQLRELYKALGRNDEALEYAERVYRISGVPSDEWEVNFLKAELEGRAALEALAREVEGGKYGPSYRGARVELYFALGDVDRALSLLERAIRERRAGATAWRSANVCTAVDPATGEVRHLHDDPRFWELMGKYNLPPLAPEHPRYAKEQAYLRAKAAGGSAKEGPPIEKIAVLPFANISGDPEEEYFVDGMTDELITELARIRSLKVISRTSAMRYKNTIKPLGDIAAELGVEAIVEGSVLRAGEDVRISAQLIDARSDEHLWASRYTGTVADVLHLQSEVALAVAQGIGAALTPEERSHLEEVRHVDSEVQDMYLRAQHLVRDRGIEKLFQGIELFEKALEKDPEFVPAQVGMADVYVLCGIFEYRRPREAYARARAAIERALAVDPNNGAAYATRGFLTYMDSGDATAAERDFRTSLELAPGIAQSHIWYAIFLNSQNRIGDAEPWFESGGALDPFAPMSSISTSNVSSARRDYETAWSESRRAIELYPDYIGGYLFASMAALMLGHSQEAVVLLEHSAAGAPDGDMRVGLLGAAYEANGQHERAAALRDDLIQRYESGETYLARHVARIYLAEGENELAIDWLERAVPELSYGRFDISLDGAWDPLRQDERFLKILREANIPSRQ